MPLHTDRPSSTLTPAQESQVRHSLSQVSAGVRPHLRPGSHLAATVNRRQQLRAFTIGMLGMVVLVSVGLTAAQMLRPDEGKPTTVVANSPGVGAPMSSVAASPGAGTSSSPAMSQSSPAASSPASSSNPPSASSPSSTSVQAALSHPVQWSTAPSSMTSAQPRSAQLPSTAAEPKPETPLLPDEGKPGWTQAPWSRADCSDNHTATLSQAVRGQRSINSEAQESFTRESVGIFADATSAQAFLDDLRTRNTCGIRTYDAQSGTHFTAHALPGYGEASLLLLQSWFNQQPDGNRVYPPGGSYLLAARVGGTVVLVEGYGEWINSIDPDRRALQEYGAILQVMLDRFGSLDSL